ncbi:MAG: prepilin-type N-terminal cleavage/methylation domain-containing protein [Chthoniobacteraceae bacterium]
MNTLIPRGALHGRKSRGFSLVEVSVAMGIAAVSLTSILGLLPIGSSSTRNAIEQTRAASIAKVIVSDLRNAASGSASPLYNFTPASASGSSVLYFSDDCFSHSTTVTASSRFRATVTFPTSSGGVVNANVLLSWPAAAAPTQASGSYEVFTMLGANQ